MIDLADMAASRARKVRLGRSLAQKPFAYPAFYCDLDYHGTALRVWSSELGALKGLLSYVPDTWRLTRQKPSRNVFWYDIADPEWDLDADSDLLVFPAGETEVAVQRDFLGLRRGNDMAIYTSRMFGDGFLNASRWFLPPILLGEQKFLMHSSAVVDPLTGEATLFLGCSGAGKTTMAAKAVSSHEVLGDDMNLVSYEQNQVWVEPGAFGQNSKFNPEMDRRYRVRAFCFLRQAAELTCRPLTVARAAFSLLPCVQNPHWQITSAETAGELLRSIQLIVSHIDCYYLTSHLDHSFAEIEHAIRDCSKQSAAYPVANRRRRCSGFDAAAADRARAQ